MCQPVYSVSVEWLVRSVEQTFFFFPVVLHKISLGFSCAFCLLNFFKTMTVSRGFGGVLNRLGFKDFT